MFDFQYAAFIVPAFAITLGVFIGMIVLSLNHARHWRRRFEDLSARAKAPK